MFILPTAGPKSTVRQGLSVRVCSFVSLFLAATGMSSHGLDTLSSFDSFIANYGRTYVMGSKEYEKRRAVFEHRLEQVQQQNRKPHRLWNAAVNHLSDRTETELSQLRGLRALRNSNRGAVGAVGAHRVGNFLGQIQNAVLPKEKSWASLRAAKMEVDQGSCGSCWAISTSVMLQANAEINGYNRTFSAQELVSCVPNPHHCGGTGGCQGSTSELAMNWVAEKGLDSAATTPYVADDGSCKKHSAVLVSRSDSGNRLKEMTAVGFHASGSQGLSLGMQGWERLAENQYEPLMRAVADVGTVVVSVGAEGWNGYGAGIFDDCSRNVVINHAVTLIGYGDDKERKQMYWNIKNSWGLDWGENGNIRLLRHDGVDHCGTDFQPELGTGCDGGPESVKVCGMCGILYDSVVADFSKNKA